MVEECAEQNRMEEIEGEDIYPGMDVRRHNLIAEQFAGSSAGLLNQVDGFSLPKTKNKSNKSLLSAYCWVGCYFSSYTYEILTIVKRLSSPKCYL